METKSDPLYLAAFMRLSLEDGAKEVRSYGAKAVAEKLKEVAPIKERLKKIQEELDSGNWNPEYPELRKTIKMRNKEILEIRKPYSKEAAKLTVASKLFNEQERAIILNTFGEIKPLTEITPDIAEMVKAALSARAKDSATKRKAPSQ